MAQRRGKLLVISAPSGAGKSTVCEKLRRRCPDVAVSISYTTRSPRGCERDGIEYHFVSDTTFDRMVQENEFLEWANVHGKRYGSGRADTMDLLAQGKDVLFDIDVQGGVQIKHSIPEAVLIFVLPPSFAELVRRLRGRGTETDEQVKTRLRAAAWELEQGEAYDIHVVNDDLDKAVAEIDQIRSGFLPELKKRSELVQAMIREAAATL